MSAVTDQRTALGVKPAYAGPFLAGLPGTSAPCADPLPTHAAAAATRCHAAAASAIHSLELPACASMHAQVFLWMGDHLAAFFALPPSRALVGEPPRVGPGKGGGVALRQAVRPDLVAGMQALNVAGPACRTGAGRGRGRGGARGSDGLSARARANAWIQRAGQLSAVSDNGAAAESQDAQDGGHDAPPAPVPAAAVLRKDGGASAQGRGGGGARGGKKGSGQAKGNMPVAAKNQREMLWDGQNVGKLPNMMWRAVSMEDLRMHPHFVSLPGIRVVCWIVKYKYIK